MLTYTYKTFKFFLSTLILGAIFAFLAAYVSYQPTLQSLLFPLILLGISSPTIVALLLLTHARNKKLWSDFLQRLSFNKIKLYFIPIILLFMPCLILCAIAISLLFGFSSDQFLFSQFSPDQVLEGKSLITLIIIIFLSCALEEVGWRGYGIDSLNSKFDLLKTSLIFATLWSLWHIPSFFIKNGYFQQEIWNLGIMYVATYFISLFPITILINWVYVKNNRSILIAILSHAIMNISYGFFQIQSFTKIIIMFLLLLVAGIIVIKDKEIFLKNMRSN